MNNGITRIVFIFRVFIVLVLVFTFPVKSHAQDQFSYGKKKTETKKFSQDKKNLFDNPLISWLIREPMQRIWLETQEISLKGEENRDKHSASHDKKIGDMDKDSLVSFLNSNTPKAKLPDSSGDTGKNPEKDIFPDREKELTRLSEKADLFEDTINPEMTGRARVSGNSFLPYDPTGTRFDTSEVLREKDTGGAEHITFNKKLSQLETESRLTEESKNVSFLREPFGHPRKKKPEKKKRLTLEEEEGPFRIQIKGDEVRYQGGMVTVDGNARVEYRGITLTSDSIDYNRYSQEIEAKGNVVFSRDGDELTGSLLKYDPVTQNAFIKDAYGHAENISVGDIDLQQTIFFRGEEVSWKNGIIRIKRGCATTCDVAPPDYHYHITGDEITIIPKDKMLVKKARFFMGKSQWFGLPSAVFPLKQRDPRQRQSYIPQVGRNQQEGFYVKESVGYLWGEKDYGTVHLDWYDKVGIGAGLEHWYHLGDRGAGKVNYYQMGSSSSTTNRYNFSNRTYYKFPGNFFASVNYTTERYEYPEYSSPDIKNADFYLSHFSEKERSALRVRDYISGDNRNYGVNILNRYDFTKNLYTQVVLDFLSTENTLRRLYRFNTIGRLVCRGDIFDTVLTYDRTSGDRKFYVNREPEVMLRSTPQKLGPLDYRVSMAVGSFNEMPSDISTLRSDLRLSLLNKIYPITKSTDFSVAGGFRQLIYGTGEKKYVGRALSNLEQRIGKNFSVVATHYFQQKNGYSPLALDYFDNYNMLGGTLEYFNRKNLRMQLTGGYDLNHKQYQSMIPRLEYLPSKDWRFTFSSNYDVERKEWMNIDGEVGMKITKTATLKYWGLYDVVNQKMTYQNYVMEFDSHDFATRLIYKGSQGEIWLSLALKAFPYEKIEVGPDADRNIIEKSLLERAPDDEGL